MGAWKRELHAEAGAVTERGGASRRGTAGGGGAAMEWTESGLREEAR